MTITALTAKLKILNGQGRLFSSPRPMPIDIHDERWRSCNRGGDSASGCAGYFCGSLCGILGVDYYFRQPI